MQSTVPTKSSSSVCAHLSPYTTDELNSDSRISHGRGHSLHLGLWTDHSFPQTFRIIMLAYGKAGLAQRAHLISTAERSKVGDPRGRPTSLG